MDYELAKELKDAGFPMTGVTWSWKMKEDGTDREHVPNPTLEELIEACGEEFHAVLCWPEGKTWDAQSRHYGSTRGTTPTEAVARLWIALNKK